MVISRTPYRISFFGGGTDYPGWYREHGGAVLATSIDKYCYITCRNLPPFFEHRIRVVYSKIENCASSSDVAHPSVRAVLEQLGVSDGVEIHHDGDLPARSGMGTSSAFTVGLLNAMHALLGRVVDKHALMTDAIHIEQDVLHETVGSQDQATAVYGGFNRIDFSSSGEIIINPLPLSTTRVEQISGRVLLFYTGIKRTASDIAGTYVPGLLAKPKALKRLHVIVDEACDLIAGDGPLDDIGELLHETWCIKRSLSGAVTNPEVDELYTAAREAGATGGKLAGAGGGGFMVLWVPIEHQAAVRKRLAGLIEVPVKFESAGTRIIFCDRQLEYWHGDESDNNARYRLFRAWDAA